MVTPQRATTPEPRDDKSGPSHVRLIAENISKAESCPIYIVNMSAETLETKSDWLEQVLFVSYTFEVLVKPEVAIW